MGPCWAPSIRWSGEPRADSVSDAAVPASASPFRPPPTIAAELRAYSFIIAVIVAIVAVAVSVGAGAGAALEYGVPVP